MFDPSHEPLRTICATRFPVRVGRRPEFGVAFPEFSMVSNPHAEFVLEAGKVMLTPLSTKNRTILNGQPISGPTEIKAGDLVHFGHTGPALQCLGFGEPTPAD